MNSDVSTLAEWIADSHRPCFLEARASQPSRGSRTFAGERLLLQEREIPLETVLSIDFFTRHPRCVLGVGSTRSTAPWNPTARTGPWPRWRAPGSSMLSSRRTLTAGTSVPGRAPCGSCTVTGSGSYARMRVRRSVARCVTVDGDPVPACRHAEDRCARTSSCTANPSTRASSRPPYQP